MTFTYIDGIFLAIIALSVFFCTFRGFARSVLNFFSFFVKLVISFFLCKPIGNLIFKWTTWDDVWSAKIHNWASGLSDIFNINLVGMDQAAIDGNVNSALSTSNFPKILRGLFKSLVNITPESLQGQTEITLADIVGNTFSRLAIYAIIFLVLFVVLFVVIFILKRTMKKVMQKHKVLNRTDKILGAVLGLIEGLFTVVTIFTFLSLFKNASFMTGFFNTLDKSCIAGPVSNFMIHFIEKYFNFTKFI